MTEKRTLSNAMHFAFSLFFVWDFSTGLGVQLHNHFELKTIVKSRDTGIHDITLGGFEKKSCLTLEACGHKFNNKSGTLYL